ncbi:MAG: hypothetical protein Q4E47_02110 [Candidatus Saccharibacteria bacterium]|nr:hypothetical protein [Candidatus Saccharibacteria bacterium]
MKRKSSKNKFLVWAEKNRTIISVIIAVLFAASQIPALIMHEPTTGEYATWASAKGVAIDYSTVIDHTEPQMGVWKAILAPLAWMGFPMITANILALVFTALAIFLLCKNVRANIIVKVAVVLSAIFIYYSPVIASNYSLIPLAMVLVAMFYSKRLEKPLQYGLSVLFLMSTHFVLAFVGIILAIEFVVTLIQHRYDVEAGQVIVKFGIPVAIGIVLLVIGLVSANGLTAISVEGYDLSDKISRLLGSLSEAMFGINAIWPICVAAGLILAATIFAKPNELLMLTGSIIVVSAFLLFVYNGEHYVFQRGVLVMSVLALFALIASESEFTKRKWLNVVFYIILALPFIASAPKAITSYIDNINQQTSGVNNLTNFMKELVGDQKVAFISAELETQTALLPARIQDVQIYNALNKEKGKKLWAQPSVETPYYDYMYLFAPDDRTLEIYSEIADQYDHIYLVLPSSGENCEKVAQQYEKSLAFEINAEDRGKFTLEKEADYPENFKTLEFTFYQMK